MLGNGKVFISHSHEDNDRLAPLLTVLKSWGVDYWIDTEEFSPGQPISKRIQEEIGQRDAFIKICSVAAHRKAYWLEQEFAAFQGLQAKDENANFKGKRIFIPFVLDKEYADLYLEPFERVVLCIMAFASPEGAWVESLRKALGIEQPPPIGLTPIGDEPPANPPGSAVTAMLRSMDVALTDEIDKVKKFKIRHAAVDGHLLGTVEGQRLYSFTLEEP